MKGYLPSPYKYKGSLHVGSGLREHGCGTFHVAGTVPPGTSAICSELCGFGHGV